MLGIRIVGAGAGAIAVALALSSAQAQTATSEQVGKPLALLAGLRPPHESSTRPRQNRARNAQENSRQKDAPRQNGRCARPPHLDPKNSEERTPRTCRRRVGLRRRTAGASRPGRDAYRDWSAVNSAPAANSVAALASDTTVRAVGNHAAGVDARSNPTAVKVQTVKITAPDQANARRSDRRSCGPQRATPSDDSAVAPPQQTALVAPVHRDESAVGSASWIAQVLAALGGAIAAGAVAWFLIGAGPVRTYTLNFRLRASRLSPLTY